MASHCQHFVESIANQRQMSGQDKRATRTVPYSENSSRKSAPSSCYAPLLAKIAARPSPDLECL